MHFIGTFIWSFILITMVNYVVSSVQAVPFDFMLGVYISIAAAIMIFIISALMPEPAPEKH